LTVSLSSKQFVLLLALVRKGSWTIEDAVKFRQDTYGSFLVRKYIEWLPDRKKFKVTMRGKNAIKQFKEADILRRIESSKLSCYFYRENNNVIPIRRAG